MKTVMKLAFLFLLTLTLSSCKTKEKVTESIKETAQSSTTKVMETAGQTEQRAESNSFGETTHTQCSDSIVERYHERIVTDSSGHVLWHEIEHSKDHYTGKSQDKTNLTSNRLDTVTDKNTSVSKEQKDSVYNGGMLQEVAVVKSRSWTWLWYVGLLVLLFIVVAIIIYKIRK